MQFVIVHGTEGRPEVNWFPWLTWQLMRKGHDVFVPRLPTPENQSLSSWKEAFYAQTPKIDSNTVLIGHSTGPAFLFRVLEESAHPCGGLVCVAGFCRLLESEHFDPLIKTFVENPFDWKTIQKNGGKILTYHGEQDPYVSVDHGEEIAKHLGTTLTLVSEGRHLNAEAGYFEFTRLLKDLELHFGV